MKDDLISYRLILLHERWVNFPQIDPPKIKTFQTKTSIFKLIKVRKTKIVFRHTNLVLNKIFN